MTKEFILAFMHNYFRSRVYIYSHACYTMFAIVDAFLSLYFIISNHLISRFIIVKCFSIKVSSWYYLLILYGPVISTNNLSYGMTSASLAGKWTHFKLCLLFL